MNIKDIIARYDIKLITVGDNKGNLSVNNAQRATRDNAIEDIKKLKPQIIKELQRVINEENQAAEERERKIANIAGLELLQNAKNEWEDYRYKYEQCIDNDWLDYPSKPAVSVDELADKYPRAAAYIKAENYKMASHYAKSAAGGKALERIINGDNYSLAITDMEKEWTKHCNEHLWD